MMPFNRPPYTGHEDEYVLDAMRSEQISGDGPYSRRCQTWFESNLRCSKAFLTPSCTQALEICALLLDIQPGDEVIMPSYTFVSTANAFALRGAKIIFVDIRPDILCIDEALIEAAITSKTKAIVPVHYAGVGCDMDIINDIADRHGLVVIEDAAHGIHSSFRGRALGSLGHLAAYSFHETKNITSGGEGGLLIINDEQYIERAEIIRDKGTNRNKFFRGEVDKYSWVNLGSSYLPSEVQAAYLWGQLEQIDAITANRMRSWQRYRSGLSSLECSGLLSLPVIPPDCTHNGHMFYIKVADLATRAALIAHMRKAGVCAVFHYVPLHSSQAGKTHGYFHGVDRYSTVESGRIVRLPMYYGLKGHEIDCAIDAVRAFFS
jgi:dTDP-4-amino-4,6-dideoxygalactose transaminase